MKVSSEGTSGVQELRVGSSDGGGRHSQFKQFLKFLRDVTADVFIASLAVYLVLLLLEQVERGFASFFFNTDILLAVVLITGFLAMFTRSTIKDEDTSGLTPAAKPMVFLGICALGILGMVMIYFGTSATGTALFWSLVTGGILIILLTILLLFDSERIERG